MVWLSTDCVAVHGRRGCPWTVWLSADVVAVHRQCGCPWMVWLSTDGVAVHGRCGCSRTVWLSMDSVAKEGCPNFNPRPGRGLNHGPSQVGSQKSYQLYQRRTQPIAVPTCCYNQLYVLCLFCNRKKLNELILKSL